MLAKLALFRVLETFDGFVDKVDGEANIAYVHLQSRFNGDVLYGDYSAKKLSKKGINEQDSFTVKTYKFLWWTGIIIKYKPPKKLTQEEYDKIAHDIEERFKDYEMTDDY